MADDLNHLFFTVQGVMPVRVEPGTASVREKNRYMWKGLLYISYRRGELFCFALTSVRWSVSIIWVWEFLNVPNIAKPIHCCGQAGVLNKAWLFPLTARKVHEVLSRISDVCFFSGRRTFRYKVWDSWYTFTKKKGIFSSCRRIKNICIWEKADG